jgi:hypothetical protein
VFFADRLPAGQQKPLATAEPHRLALLQGDALLVQILDVERLVELRIGRGGKRRDQYGRILFGIGEARKGVARDHAGRRHKPDARAGRELRIGGAGLNATEARKQQNGQAGAGGDRAETAIAHRAEPLQRTIMGGPMRPREP